MITEALSLFLGITAWAVGPRKVAPAIVIDSPSSVSAMPDRRFILAQHESRIRVWHALTGSLIADVPGSGGAVDPRTSVAILGAEIWNLNDRVRLIDTSLDAAKVTAVGITRDGRFAVLASSDIHIWNIASRQLIGRAGNPSRYTTFLAVSNDAHFIAVGRGPQFDVVEMATGRLVKTGALAAVWPYKTRPIKGFSEFVHGKALDFAVIFENKDFDFSHGPRPLWKLDWESGKVNIFANSPPKNLLAAVPRGKRVEVVWNREGDKRALLLGHTAEVGPVAFSPDRWSVATGDKSGKVFFWHAHSGELRYEYTGGDQAIQSLSFSPDAQFLLASTTSTIRVYAVTP